MNNESYRPYISLPSGQLIKMDSLEAMYRAFVADYGHMPDAWIEDFDEYHEDALQLISMENSFHELGIERELMKSMFDTIHALLVEKHGFPSNEGAYFYIDLLWLVKLMRAPIVWRP